MLIGKKLGPYLINKELGSGSMGTVYRAKHQETGRTVAIKMMAPGFAKDSTLARFQREASILKQLDDPHIVKLIGTGKLQNQPFFIMEFIDGESLDHVMERRGRISWEEVVTLGEQLCSALQHAHDKGIIHRDLKPANVMVLPGDILKLTDFGIAKDTDVTQLTAANSTVGTAAYMSPEQCQGARDINHKSDLYSLGVMLYELVTGRKPYLGETVMEMFRQHLEGTFERPSRIVLDIPIWLDTLICQLMEKEPDKRPLNANLVAQALSQVKEKVQAQRSAGIDAVKKRRVDKSSHDARFDDEDKEAARTLLGKKKKKTVPIYQQGWFTVAALALVVIGLGLGAYLLFFKAASPESLYSQAQQLMSSGEQKEARDGPIAQFLQLYPQHPQAEQVRRWADQVDLETRERQMHNRRNSKFPSQDEAESIARMALDNEDAGKLEEAKKNWQDLKAYKGTNFHPWALIAEKYHRELLAVDDLYQSVQAMAKNKKTGADKAEALAVDAAREELDEKVGPAKINWIDLKRLAESQADGRRWYLLAAQRLRQIEVGQK